MTIAHRSIRDLPDVLPDPGSGILIGGEWREGRATFPVLDPGTGAALADVADATLDDATSALEAAHRAQTSFVDVSPRTRADLLLRAYHALLDREIQFAQLITLEMGKPYEESLGEVRYAAEYLRWFAEEAPRIGGESRVLPDGESRMITVPRPVGVCVLVTPWNFPLAMITRKLAPAIAAGCASIVKPAEDTPLTVLAFAQLLIEVGAPDGIINVLPTLRPAGVVERLLVDGRARKLSFTGSTAVGRQLLATASQQVMRCSMELGGNAPFIVFPDADIEGAVDAAMVAKFRNGGQACTAANRFFVHSAVADEFTALLLGRVAELRMGHGLDEGTTLGPLINRKAADRAHRLLTDIESRGAEIVVGGAPTEDNGSFVEPTVVTHVPDDAPLRTDEIFAPVVGISTFETEAEVIARANATDYGLVAYAFTASEERQYRLAARLEYGMVGVNRGLVSNAAAPFGGIKHSGLGREGSHEGLDEYLDYIYLALNN